MMIRTLAAFTLFCVAASMPLGCASRADRARDRALDSTLSFQQRLDAMPGLIDATVEDLMAATAGQNANRAGDFQTFDRSVAQLQDAARYVGVQYQEALANSNEFFSEWTRAGRVQGLSASERQALEQEMGQRLATRADAISYFDQARSSFLDLSNDLATIRTNLAGNLSEQNVLAQNDLIQRAILDANDTKNYIDRLDEVLASAVSMQ